VEDCRGLLFFFVSLCGFPDHPENNKKSRDLL